FRKIHAVAFKSRRSFTHATVEHQLSKAGCQRLEDASMTHFGIIRSVFGLVRGIILGSLVAVISANHAPASFIVFEAAAPTPGAIAPTRAAFGAAVGGGVVAGANGDFGGVRREINWDGVPDAFADPLLLPGDFFNSNSPRGLVYSTPGSGFLVSSNTGSTLFGF